MIPANAKAVHRALIFGIIAALCMLYGSSWVAQLVEHKNEAYAWMTRLAASIAFIVAVSLSHARREKRLFTAQEQRYAAIVCAGAASLCIIMGTLALLLGLGISYALSSNAPAPNADEGWMLIRQAGLFLVTLAPLSGVMGAIATHPSLQQWLNSTDP